MTASTLSPSKTLPARELVADLQPVPPAMTPERYTQIILLAWKYFGHKPAKPFGRDIATVIGRAEDDLLRRLFAGASAEEDVELWYELRQARRIALIGGRLRESCGMAEAKNSQIFEIALQVAQIEYINDQS